MPERQGPQVYSIAAHRGFADALVAGLIPRYADWCRIDLRESEGYVPAFTYTRPEGEPPEAPEEATVSVPLAARDIELLRAKVGDRYVLEQMVERKWMLGGENSGHVICLDKHTTGDGIIAALAVLRALIEQNVTLAQATADVRMFPQKLINVPVARGFDWRGNEDVIRAERDTVASLGDRGVAFRSLREAIDTSTPAGRLVLGIFGSLAE